MQKLNKVDPDRREEFCENMMNIKVAEEHFPRRIAFFFDEATLLLYNNRHYEVLE